MNKRLSVETVIRNKCLFLWAALDAALLLVTWSVSKRGWGGCETMPRIWGQRPLKYNADVKVVLS